MTTKPHVLLFCDGHNPKQAAESFNGIQGCSSRGHWRFILENLDAGTRMEVSDAELMFAPERAALLAVVRGLEALDQPSRVTLVTTSRYVARGLQFGLAEWRESNYCWEHFGSVQPIRNADLWRRIDHAMQFHHIHCRWIAGEIAEEGETASQLKVEPLTANKDESISFVQSTDARPGRSPKITPEVHRKNGVRNRRRTSQNRGSNSQVTRFRALCQSVAQQFESLRWLAACRRNLGI